MITPLVDQSGSRVTVDVVDPATHKWKAVTHQIDPQAVLNPDYKQKFQALLGA